MKKDKDDLELELDDDINLIDNDDDENAQENNIDVEDIFEENVESELDSLDDSEFYNDSNEFEYDNFDSLINSQSALVNQNIAVSDPVKMFLKEIGSVNLLTPEAERDIAKIIYDYKAEIDLYNEKIEGGYIPTLEEEEYYRKKNIELENAKNTLSEANLRLVVNIAKHFSNHNMEFADLIQEGYIGLSKAVVKFDYTRGNKFSTYATGWIKQAITRAIADQSRTIRIPVHMNETINKMNKKENELTYELGRKPTPEELAQAMDIPINKLMMIKASSLKTKSLEETVGDDEDSTYGDFVPDNDNPNPEQYAEIQAQKDLLDKYLSYLSYKEERVLRLRYGLIDGRIRTLEEIGEEFDLTRERIRQIQSKAINKLRKKLDPILKNEFK